VLKRKAKQNQKKDEGGGKKRGLNSGKRVNSRRGKRNAAQVAEEDKGDSIIVK